MIIHIYIFYVTPAARKTQPITVGKTFQQPMSNCCNCYNTNYYREDPESVHPDAGGIGAVVLLQD